jgi:hypothetical protein
MMYWYQPNHDPWPRPGVAIPDVLDHYSTLGGASWRILRDILGRPSPVFPTGGFNLSAKVGGKLP